MSHFEASVLCFFKLILFSEVNPGGKKGNMALGEQIQEYKTTIDTKFGPAVFFVEMLAIS